MSRADADELNDTMVQGLADADAAKVASVYAPGARLLPPGMDVQTASADAPVVDAGKFLIVHRRQPHGSWKYAMDMFNSSLPPGAT